MPVCEAEYALALDLVVETIHLVHIDGFVIASAQLHQKGVDGSARGQYARMYVVQLQFVKARLRTPTVSHIHIHTYAHIHTHTYKHSKQY